MLQDALATLADFTVGTVIVLVHSALALRMDAAAARRRLSPTAYDRPPERAFS
jgi:hypothetical protein